MSRPDVVVVGAGLAGLSTALSLQARGAKVQLFEASDAVGGRLRTDIVDGFQLDRGFQVLLTAYPECQQALDYERLQLASFRSGARVFSRGSWHTVADPFREPLSAIPAAFNRIGTMRDKLLIARLRRHTMTGPLAHIWERPETTIEQYLRDFGFSARLINQFFRPFFGGILLDRALQPSSRLFEFIFRMFALGEAALPAHGIQAIPEQLAGRLSAGSLFLNTPVAGVEARRVVLAGGEEVKADAVVVAVEASAFPSVGLPLEPPRFRSVSCVYFSAPADVAESRGTWLYLNGERSGLFNNVAFPSALSPHYAPPGQALVSVAVIGSPSADLAAAVRRELVHSFGREAKSWQHLRTYRIVHAQPALRVRDGGERPARTAGGYYLAGDHRTTPSINGAMLAGRRAALAVWEDLQRSAG